MSEISVARTAFLLSIKIRSWTGNKTDRITSEEVVKSKGADKNAGVFVKRLLGKCDALTAINTMAASSRARIQNMCLPYSVRGVFFVPVKNYEKVIAAVREEQTLFYSRLDEFKKLYPDLIEKARARNSELFNEEEIPSLDELENKFDFDWSVMPIPDPAQIDGFFNIPNMEEEIRQNMEEQNDKLKEQNFNILRSRIREVAEHVHEKFKNFDGTRKNSFRNQMVEKSLKSIQDNISLNVFEDKRIEAWCNTLEGIFSRGSSQYFKSSSSERDLAIQELSQLLNGIG